MSAPVPDELRDQLISALDAVVYDREASEALADAALPLFANEHERARQAEQGEFTAVRRAERAEAEVARLRAGESDQPAAEGARPTPAEWIYRWNRATAEERLAMVGTILTAIEAAERCFLMDHEGLHQELEAARRRNQKMAIQVDRARLPRRLRRRRHGGLMARRKGGKAPFRSRAQWRWAFATKKSFARRWAHKTPGGPKVRYRRLPGHVRRRR